MNKHLTRRIIQLIILTFFSSVSAQTPVNYFLSYERVYKSETWTRSGFKLAALFEDGNTIHGRDFSEDHVSVLRIYHKSESTLAMLKGAEQGSAIHQLANMLMATDDGERGRFLLDGKFERFEVILSARYKLPFTFFTGDFDIGVYMPLVFQEVSDVEWVDQTLEVTNADLVVKNNLTNDIDSLVFNLGEGLKIRDCDNDGFGDLALIFKWQKDFTQEKNQ